MTTTITGLPNATTPLSGTERVPMDQAGATRDATTQDIANLAQGTNVSYDPATRTLASSTGTDAVLPEATTTLAGLASAADKAKLDSITVDRATLTVAAVRNNSGSSLAKGTPVYVVSSSGITPTVAAADASVEATAANTLGVMLETTANNSDGIVVTEGQLAGLNTSSLTEGGLVFLSETTGQLTSTRPTQPAHGVVIGWCVKQAAGTAGILYIKVDNGQELGELHDVLITSSATGQVLRLAASGLWTNQALAAGDVGADASGTAAAAISAHLAATDPHPQYLTTAEGNAAYVQTSDSRLSDSREWSAATATQAEAEAGTSTTRMAFTPQRVFQAIAAWWAASTAKTKLDGIAANATANQTDAFLLSRANHTGTQAAGTITGLAAVATSGAYGDLSGRLAVSSSAPAALGATATAGTSVDAARADHVHQRSTYADLGAIGDGLILVISNRGETATASTNYVEVPVPVPSGSFSLTAVRFGCHIDTTGSSGSTFNAYRRTADGVKTSVLTGNATLASAASLVDTSATITGGTFSAGDRIGVDLVGVGTGAQGLFAQFLFTRSAI